MAGIQDIRGQSLQIFNGTGKPCVCIKEMESAYDACNPLFPADTACIVRDIADSAVRAAGDDEKPFVCPAYQGGIIRAEILCFLTVCCGCTDGAAFFKVMQIGYPAEKKAVFGEENG